MNTDLLVNLGLTLPQATVYLALVQRGRSTAPDIAQATGQTRTNTYTLLDKLVELGLAERLTNTAKIAYRALSPSALEPLITSQRQAAQKRQQLLESNLPDLMSFFHTHSEQPGIRLFQGKDGIRQIYADQIATGQDILIVRTPDDIRFFPYDEMLKIRLAARDHGIHRHKIEPDYPRPDTPVGLPSKEERLLTETWVAEGGYTAPVEWDIYGNKVAVISFGKEAIGMIIDSPQIAESMRQLYHLLVAGLHRQPGYDQLPKNRGTVTTPYTTRLNQHPAGSPPASKNTP